MDFIVCLPAVWRRFSKQTQANCRRRTLCMAGRHSTGPKLLRLHIFPSLFKPQKSINIYIILLWLNREIKTQSNILELDKHLSSCQMCRLLLEHGCAVNYLSKTGETALHILTKRGRFEAAMVLLTHGANANLKGQDGNTALHLAMKVCGSCFFVADRPSIVAEKKTYPTGYTQILRFVHNNAPWLCLCSSDGSHGVD